MFFSWLKGIIGSVIGWLGLVIFLVLMWANISKEDSDWTLKVLTNLYKDAAARSAGDPAGSEAVHLHTPQYREYKFDYNPDSEKGNLIAIAYDKLKTYEDYDGASDV